MISIREANIDDLGRLAEVYSSARSSAGCFSGKPVDLNGMSALTEGEVVYVAERESQIVGFSSVWVADNFIHHLYVLPDFHGQGIGSKLLEFCEVTHGPLSLKCEVLNVGAQRFYRKKGWIVRECGHGEDGEWQKLYSPRT